MKIAFFGLDGSFNYDYIGGTNSMIRRISDALISEWDVEVEYVLIGKEDKILNFNNGVVSRHFKRFCQASDILSNYDHIVKVYLPIFDNLRFANFRRKYPTINYHNFYFEWPESSLRRELLFRINRIEPYNGKSYVVSPRLYKISNKMGNDSVLLIPPVNSNYFRSKKEKNSGNKIHITFLGRIDVNKGILETVKLFKALSNNSNFELNLYAIFWKNDPVALKLNEELSKQNDFSYTAVDYTKFDNSIDDFVIDILKNTDIFIQPYRKLSSSIDVPLLILEAMASLCAIITKPYGNIPWIYGESPFYIKDDSFNEVLSLINSASKLLFSERERILLQNENIKFSTKHIANIFYNSLLERS